MENKREKKKGSHVLYNQGLRCLTWWKKPYTFVHFDLYLFFFNSLASNKIDEDEKVMGPELSRVTTKSMYIDYDN